MSIKGKYDVHKEALVDNIKTAIAKFEEDTGCHPYQRSRNRLADRTARVSS